MTSKKQEAGEGEPLSSLKIVRGQERLTPEQETEVARFAAARVQTQFSTEPVSEQQVEAFLKLACEAAELTTPQLIRWVDGPLQLVEALVDDTMLTIDQFVGTSTFDAFWEDWCENWGNLGWDYNGKAERWSVKNNGRGRVSKSVLDQVEQRMENSLFRHVAAIVEAAVFEAAEEEVGHAVDNMRVWQSVRDILESLARESVRAYLDAPALAVSRFFDEYLEPNDLHALAHFNEHVSGYLLGKQVAIIVRRPAVLTYDVQGRLHSATSPCLQYHDGWGFYAWHGVHVPKSIILHPDQITREDWLDEPDQEIRRVIQERLGNDRFVELVGATCIDQGQRGTLVEVDLGDDDPEQVAHYIHVKDSSTERQYYLRVPPSIRSADEAVSWTFGLNEQEYQPEQET